MLEKNSDFTRFFYVLGLFFERFSYPFWELGGFGVWGRNPTVLFFKSGSACTIPNANRWLQQSLFRFIGLAWAMHTPKI
jgi:hypothetical protein